ncbi:hypothetical protein LZ496_00630 [Sphingomonas sp. NSE70-1]|uniref:DUF5672 domain-containing protein n=1 Tax=Sphingomonas caseinilyticus TaxID=2908205 RepID=A0ABT0RQW0_9SPHN|nr:DUF5672 family protein [Sphingomonas caseinilyticus]MCL6697296.1 hypothetical protein [Sphingomonas caseinilyticus]
MAKIQLPTVTLCAAASVNMPATVAALHASMAHLEFAECLLFTDGERATCESIRQVRIPRLRSSLDYSEFMIRSLPEHIRTEHCLVVQWDGFVINADRWDPSFLNFDYIGAPWPQFDDGHNVGNGGFSLRSRRLLNACRDDHFRPGGAEDLAICRVNRPMLESEFAIRFADLPTAERFSFERTMPAAPTFGFHGVFNMIEAIGEDAFWNHYLGLDDRTSAHLDFWQILRQLGRGPHASRRRRKFVVDRLAGLFRS